MATISPRRRSAQPSEPRPPRRRERESACLRRFAPFLHPARQEVDLAERQGKGSKASYRAIPGHPYATQPGPRDRQPSRVPGSKSLISHARPREPLLKSAALSAKGPRYK